MIGYISFKIVAMAKDDNLPYAWLIQLLSTVAFKYKKCLFSYFDKI